MDRFAKATSTVNLKPLNILAKISILQVCLGLECTSEGGYNREGMIERKIILFSLFETFICLTEFLFLYTNDFLMDKFKARFGFYHQLLLKLSKIREKRSKKA